MTRAQLIESIANSLTAENTCLPIFDEADRNIKADEVASGNFIFYEALATQTPLIQGTRKAYMQSQFVIWFVRQYDGTDADALDKLAIMEAIAVEFFTRLSKHSAVVLAEAGTGQGLQGIAITPVYDSGDTLVVGCFANATVNYDPSFEITACVV